MKEDELDIVGESILPVPDGNFSIRPIQVGTKDIYGKPVEILSYTFGSNARLHRGRTTRKVLNSLTKSGLRLFFYIMEELKYNSNVVSLKHNIVAVNTNMAARSVPTSINELLELNVIYKTTTQSIYVVNPKFISCCEVKEFQDRYNSLLKRLNVVENNKVLTYINKYDNGN